MQIVACKQAAENEMIENSLCTNVYMDATKHFWHFSLTALLATVIFLKETINKRFCPGFISWSSHMSSHLGWRLTGPMADSAKSWFVP